MPNIYVKTSICCREYLGCYWIKKTITYKRKIISKSYLYIWTGECRLLGYTDLFLWRWYLTARNIFKFLNIFRSKLPKIEFIQYFDGGLMKKNSLIFHNFIIDGNRIFGTEIAYGNLRKKNRNKREWNITTYNIMLHNT